MRMGGENTSWQIEHIGSSSISQNFILAMSVYVIIVFESFDSHFLQCTSQLNIYLFRKWNSMFIYEMEISELFDKF